MARKVVKAILAYAVLTYQTKYWDVFVSEFGAEMIANVNWQTPTRDMFMKEILGGKSSLDSRKLYDAYEDVEKILKQKKGMEYVKKNN